MFGNVHITRNNVKSCGVNEYQSSAPQTENVLIMIVSKSL